MIEWYTRRTKFKIASLMGNSPEVQLLVNRGNDLFIDDMTQYVFHLMKNYRVKNEKFRALLKKIWTGEVIKNDARNLMSLHFFNYSREEKGKTGNDPRTIWLFTKNAEERLKNTEKLVELSNRTKLSVARLRCE